MASSKPTVTTDGIPVHCAYNRLVAPDKLTLHDKNPNTHPDDQLQKYIHVIRANGWRRAVCVSRLSNMVTKGNGALMAARMAGWTQVPVDYQQYGSMDEELSDLVADNQLSELSLLQQDSLADVLRLIDEPLRVNTGMDNADIMSLLESNDTPTVQPPDDEDDANGTRGKRRLELAKHLVDAHTIAEGHRFKPCDRVMLFCGDAARVVAGNDFYVMGKPRAVLTDPEYFNLGYTARHENIKADPEMRLINDCDRLALLNTFAQTFLNMRLEKGFSAIVFCGWRGVELLPGILDRIGKRRSLIVFHKSISLGNTFRNGHELAWYYTDEDNYVWNGGMSQSNVMESNWPKSRFAQEKTPKPLPLLEKLLLLITDKDDLVADPFCGTAPVMQECLVNDRRYVGVEINPITFAAAIIRYAEYAKEDPDELCSKHLEIRAR